MGLQFGMEAIPPRTSLSLPGKTTLAPLWTQEHAELQILRTQVPSPLTSTVLWLFYLKRMMTFRRLSLNVKDHYRILILVTPTQIGSCCCTQCGISMENSCCLSSIFSHRAAIVMQHACQTKRENLSYQTSYPLWMSHR